MKHTYLAALCGSEGNYGIVFRDFPGCTSAAATLDEAAARAQDALSSHIAVGIEYGDEIPAPTEHALADVAAFYDDPDDRTGSEWVKLIPVTVEVPEISPLVRVDVPRTLADEVRAFDPNPGHFIVEATRRELARLKESA